MKGENKIRDYEADLVEQLKDQEFAIEYLKACLADEDPQVFLIAIQDVAKAHGGLARLAEQANLNRETLYRTLSVQGNPTYSTLIAVLSVLGFQLSLEPRESKVA
jgi:probable addiction module antidote protein